MDQDERRGAAFKRRAPTVKSSADAAPTSTAAPPRREPEPKAQAEPKPARVHRARQGSSRSRGPDGSVRTAAREPDAGRPPTRPTATPGRATVEAEAPAVVREPPTGAARDARAQGTAGAPGAQGSSTPASAQAVRAGGESRADERQQRRGGVARLDVGDGGRAGVFAGSTRWHRRAQEASPSRRSRPRTLRQRIDRLGDLDRHPDVERRRRGARRGDSRHPT